MFIQYTHMYSVTKNRIILKQLPIITQCYSTFLLLMKLLLLALLALFPVIINTKKRHHRHRKNKPANVPYIPVVPVAKSSSTCACAAAGSAGFQSSANQNAACRPAHYIDYYYREPYSGYPKHRNYLPPEETVPVIVERLTNIRNDVKGFVAALRREPDNVKKAIYVKTNFRTVKYLLKAINRAANATTNDSQ